MALEKLGHKIYDTRSMLQLGHTSDWVEAAKNLRNGNQTLLEEMISTMEDLGYTATMDFPMNLFAAAMAERRPLSKVIMTVRSEDVWLSSWANVNDIMSLLVARPWTWLVDMTFNQQLLKLLWDFDWPYPIYPAHISRPLPWFEIVTNLPGFSPGKRQEWIALHRRFREQLEQTLPSTRLLIFECSDGWQPLLNFLAIEDDQLANSTFPHTNQIAHMRMARSVLDILAITLPLWVLLSAWLIPKLIIKLCCCCIRWTPSFNVARWIWRWQHTKTKTR
eukprot:Skav221986  [mRNA]  locus=scaffold4787:2111:2941:- [translate_table: standard]